MKKSDLFKSRIKRIKRCSEDLSIYTSKELQSYSCLINKLMRKMFTKSCLIFVMLVSVCSNAQNDSISNDLSSRVFSLTPRTKKVDKVNGLAFGVGLNTFVDNPTITKVNGLHLEINPTTILVLMFVNTIDFQPKEDVIINGLNLSTGHISNSKINGVSFSFLTINHTTNGFSANLLGAYLSNQNGFHISGLSNYSQKSNGVIISMANYCEEMKGFQMAVYNNSDLFKGVQLGIYNYSKNESKGVQIGLINQSKKHKGLQVGFWNMNQKRSFPFVNW